MTPSDFKAYSDTAIRCLLVVAAIALAFRALDLAFSMPDKTLFTSLASGAVLAILTMVYQYWYGAAHKSPPPPDTVTTTTTETR